MSRFKEIAHDHVRDDPLWRVFCDDRKKYRMVIEFDENFTHRDIDRIENAIGAALHDLYRTVNHKFAPTPSGKK